MFAPLAVIADALSLPLAQVEHAAQQGAFYLRDDGAARDDQVQEHFRRVGLLSRTFYAESARGKRVGGPFADIVTARRAIVGWPNGTRIVDGVGVVYSVVKR